MKISVVTVCRNSEGTIAHTLESFLKQDHFDKELVVVDGASTDGTLAIIESFRAPNVRLISERDRGIYDAMNKGLSAFSGDAVGFLNSDDRFSSTATLSKLNQALTGVDIVYGNLDFVAAPTSDAPVRRWRGTPFARGAFQSGWMPAHPTFYVRRRVFETVGRFNERYRIAADYDYMLRCLEPYGFSSKFIDEVLVLMMYGGNSTSGLRAYFLSNLECLRSRREWLASGAVDRALLMKPLRKVPQFLGRFHKSVSPSSGMAKRV